ncbi:hypothetical protein [Mesorhizobium sp. M0203]|uniref:hypothetical protein n=1 Tax=Mesorhizobium sp. M0203 TaxID=2956912 RepID=UPI0033384466
MALTFNTAKEAAARLWAKAQLTQAVDCLVDLQVLTAQRGIAPKCRRITLIRKRTMIGTELASAGSRR